MLLYWCFFVVLLIGNDSLLFDGKSYLMQGCLCSLHSAMLLRVGLFLYLSRCSFVCSDISWGEFRIKSELNLLVLVFSIFLIVNKYHDKTVTSSECILGQQPDGSLSSVP